MVGIGLARIVCFVFASETNASPEFECPVGAERRGGGHGHGHRVLCVATRTDVVPTSTDSHGITTRVRRGGRVTQGKGAEMAGKSNATEPRMRWVHVPTESGGFRAELRWIPAPTKAIRLPVTDLAQPEAGTAA